MHWRENPEVNTGKIREIDEALREAYYRQPFVPYEVVLGNGRRLLIEELTQLAFPPSKPEIAVLLDGAGLAFFPMSEVASVVVAKRKLTRKGKQGRRAA